MARLPMYQQQVTGREFSAPAAPVNNGTAQAIGQFMQGASQLAGAIDAANTLEANTYVSETRNKATIQYTEFATELALNAKTGKEYLEGITKWSEQQRNAAIDKAPNKRAAEAATQYWNSFDAQITQNAITKSAEINATNAANVFQQTQDIAQTSVYMNPDAFDAQREIITNELQTLAIPESQKQQLITEATQSLNRSRILGVINNDPHKAVAMLQEDPQGLSSAEYERALSTALVRKEQAEGEWLAEQKRIDSQVAEMERQVEETTAKNGYELISANSLTQEWIASNRENLSQADYKYFHNKLNSPDYGNKTDIPTYAAAYNMALDAPDEAKTFAKQALLAGDLTVADFNKINDMANRSGAGELPSALKQATTYLSKISGSDAIGATIGQRERSANAINDFNMWYAENPKATPIEAVNQAKAIWSQYSLVDELAITQRSPYGTNVRSVDVTAATLSEAATKLESDKAMGLISDAKYNQEVERLFQWKTILDNQGKK